MTKTEREDMASLVRRIPCELAILTYDQDRKGSAWVGCFECARCVLLIYLESDHDQNRAALHNQLLERPKDGGYQLREDLRRK